MMRRVWDEIEYVSMFRAAGDYAIFLNPGCIFLVILPDVF